MATYLSPLFRLRDHAATHPRLWVRPLVVLGVLLVSSGAALTLPPTTLSMLLLGLSAIGVGLVFLRWPSLGLVLAAATGMTSPYHGPSGLDVTMILLAGLLVLWVTEMVLRQREVRLVPSRTTRPLLLFILVSLLSFGLGQLRWFAFATQAPLDAQLAGLAIFVVSASAFLLVANRMRDIRWLQAMTWLFLSLSLLYVIRRAVPGMTELLGLIFQQSTAGGVFWAWMPALAFSQALLNRTLQPVVRVILLVGVVLALYVGYVQNGGWKSGWVPQIVALAVIVAAWSWRTGLLLGLLGALPFWNLLQQAAAGDQYSIYTRIDAWNLIRRIVEVNPVLGLGFANYYQYTPLFPIRGWVVQFNSHNNYLDIIAQTGVLGLLCFVWFAWEVGWLGWRLRTRVPEGFARAYVYGALGGLAGMLVAAMLGDWMLPFVYNIGLQGFRTGVVGWLFLGGLVVLEAQYGQRPGALVQGGER